MKVRRRSSKFILRLIIVLVCLLSVIGFWYWQNFTFEVSENKVVSNKVTSAIRIVQLSDLHGAAYGDDNNKLVDAIIKQTPDLICVTGDMYTNGDSAGMDTALLLLEKAVTIAPVYLVPGEHDQDDEFLAAASEFGVHVLLYETDTITIKGNTITLYGIDNVYYTDTFNLFREFSEPPDGSLNLLLAHIPNFEAFNWFGPDLTLCGDTHGGVAQLPVVGPLYFNGKFLPELTNSDEYVTDKGLFQTYTGYVYVSGGLGNYPYPIRMFNRPELSVLQIQPGE